MSDIVKRLLTNRPNYDDNIAAAEEIERLTAERDALRALLRDARGFVGYFEMTPAQHVAQKSIELGKKIDAALKGDEDDGL